MKLLVPVVLQPPRSSDCGVACIAMLLEYYKISYSYAKLRTELSVYRWGTTMPQLGIWLLKNGFAVEIVTMHPSLFYLTSRFPSSEAVLKHLRSLRRGIRPRLNAIALEHLISFVKLGGVLTPRVPGYGDMRVELAAKRPLVSLLTHWFLQQDSSKPHFTFHFNVVTGLDAKRVFVNDPDWGSPGGSHAYGQTEYLYAMYASAYGALDNASLMKVRKIDGSKV